MPMDNSIAFLGILLVCAGSILWISVPVHAQCGETLPKSSCLTCHEQQAPVYEKGEWHLIHGRKDCCSNCHGGNCTTTDKELAHEKLVVHQLEDIYTNCYSCHPKDYQARAEKIALLLGVTPMSSPTATPAPLSPIVEHPIVIPQPSTSISPINPPLPLVLVVVTCIGFLLLILWIFYRRSIILN